MVNPALILGGLAGAGSLLGGKKADKAGGQAADSISQFWEMAQQQYMEMFNQALSALESGEAEASDEILQGLGMSIDERTKFFDIANENLDWIVDFGKDSSKDARQFMDHYSDLIFNPDAIYDTEVYKSIKDRTMDEWQNFYSGKGLLGGNAQEAMVDRMSELGYNFLQGERDAALSGFGSAMQGTNLGAQAASQQSDMAMRTGNANAADIMNAHTNLAGITQAFNPASFLMQGADFLGGGTANAGTAIANTELAGNLGQSNIIGGLGNALISGLTSGGFEGLFNQNQSSDGANEMLSRMFLSGSSFGPAGPNF